MHHVHGHVKRRWRRRRRRREEEVLIQSYFYYYLKKYVQHENPRNCRQSLCVLCIVLAATKHHPVHLLVLLFLLKFESFWGRRKKKKYMYDMINRKVCILSTSRSILPIQIWLLQLVAAIGCCNALSEKTHERVASSRSGHHTGRKSDVPVSLSSCGMYQAEPVSLGALLLRREAVLVLLFLAHVAIKPHCLRVMR